MMQLNKIKKTVGRRKPKRYGLGKGAGSKTNGRGQKGQQSRVGGGLPYAGFEGGQTPLQRRIPKRGFKNFTRVEYVAVNLSTLEAVDGGVEITPEFLRAQGVIRADSALIKILGGGELTKKIHVKAHAFSQSAVAKIKSLGGTAEVLG